MRENEPRIGLKYAALPELGHLCKQVVDDAMILHRYS